MTNKPEFEVKEGRIKAKIVVPHQGKRITFTAPPCGPSTCYEVRNKIYYGHNPSLLRPTIAETISLIYSATENKDNGYAQDILNMLKNEGFWGFNQIRYEPQKGAFVSNRNKKDIQVPFGFQVGRHTLDELVKNPFVLALTEGEEGAEKLARIAKSEGMVPYVHSKEQYTGETITQVPSLNKASDALVINGDRYFLSGNSWAFGLSSKKA